ncbi:MAG: hypothetical protein VX494_14725 [Actinomycetota bacterium]|nr:hypothetical protein [Actinomycetota bacterium]
MPVREYLRLLRGTVRALDLEREIATHRREGARARAEVLLVDRGPMVTERVRDAVARSSLPVTESGDLHEAAFLALVDAMTWEQRDAQLRSLTGGAKETKP